MKKLSKVLAVGMLLLSNNIYANDPVLPDGKLLKAVLDCDATAIQRAIANNANVDMVFNDQTALEMLIRLASLDNGRKKKKCNAAIEALMKNGASDFKEKLTIEERDYGTYGAIFSAIQNNNLDAAKIIFKYKPEALKNETCVPLIHMAIIKDNQASLTWLLERGLDVEEIHCKTRDTTLFWVAGAGLAKYAKILLKYGADPLKKSEQGDTPMDVARDNKRTGVLKLFEDHINGSK